MKREPKWFLFYLLAQMTLVIYLICRQQYVVLINPYQIVFRVLFLISIVVGLTPWGLRLSDQQSYPFFGWRLFDTPQANRTDYLVRVTCGSDPDTEKQISTIIENVCISNAIKNFSGRDFHYAVQSIINEYHVPTADSDIRLQRKLEELFAYPEYKEMLIIKRTYNPKEYYYSRKLNSYEKIKVFSKF